MGDFLLVLLSGYSIGILGSLHCVGMCGPIALSLPIHTLPNFQKWWVILLYNFGRTLTYAFLGLTFGIIGQTFSFFKIQRALSITAGIVLLLFLFGQIDKIQSLKIFNKFTSSIKVALSKQLQSQNKRFSYLFIGILNGFLPCGLVYLGLTSAVSTGSMLKSSLLMIGFGLGTIPLMILVMVFGKFISLKLRRIINKILPILIFLLAILLILRGSNLGIPYLSPQENVDEINCHR